MICGLDETEYPIINIFDGIRELFLKQKLKIKDSTSD